MHAYDPYTTKRFGYVLHHFIFYFCVIIKHNNGIRTISNEWRAYILSYVYHCITVYGYNETIDFVICTWNETKNEKHIMAVCGSCSYEPNGYYFSCNINKSLHHHRHHHCQHSCRIGDVKIISTSHTTHHTPITSTIHQLKKLWISKSLVSLVSYGMLLDRPWSVI